MRLKDIESQEQKWKMEENRTCRQCIYWVLENQQGEGVGVQTYFLSYFLFPLLLKIDILLPNLRYSLMKHRRLDVSKIQ